MVLAANLSHAAIHEALTLGRTALKMSSALDPMADIILVEDGGTSGVVRVGGSLFAAPGVNVTLTVTMSLPRNVSKVGLAAAVSRSRRAPAAAASLQLQLVRNNEVWYTQLVSLPPGGAPVNVTVSAQVPQGGTDRWRAEVHDAGTDGVLRTMTNHLFVVAAGV